MKLLYNFNETLGHFPAVFMATELDIFSRDIMTFPAVLFSNETGYVGETLGHF